MRSLIVVTIPNHTPEPAFKQFRHDLPECTTVFKAIMAEQLDTTRNSAVHNGLLLERHVLEKGFQSGGFLALLVFGPIKAFQMRRSPFGLKGYGIRALNIAASSAVWVTLISGESGHLPSFRW